ncbi:MAG: carbon storage regulator, partial [Planctomycetota bacterium]
MTIAPYSECESPRLQCIREQGRRENRLRRAAPGGWVMLVLSRKVGEEIVIDGNIVLSVVEI